MSNQTVIVESSPDFMLTREFDAPRALIWEAWTKPEHLTKWWGPVGFDTPVFEVDLRVGGKMKFCMRGPEGMEIWCGGEYLEIDEPSRYLSTSYFCDAEGNQIDPVSIGFSPEWPKVSQFEVAFEDLGERTRVTVHQFGISVDLAKSVMADQGWGSQFTKLDQLIAEGGLS